MKIIMIDDLSFNNNSIKVIERVKTNQIWGINFYCNIANEGICIHKDFNDLLGKDNSVSKLAYEFIIEVLLKSQSSFINISDIMNAQSVLYRRCIEEISSGFSYKQDLFEMKKDVMKKFSEYLSNYVSELCI